MTVVAGDRRRNPSVPIRRCKAALRRPTTAHPRAHQSVKIFLAASHTVARRLRETWDRPLTMEIPASSLGKGDPQVAQYSTVPTVPTASRSRLRHLALLCDHAGIAPRSIFSFPSPYSQSTCFRASGTNRVSPLPPSPFVRPGRWVLRDRLRFGFRFPRFRSFATLSPPLSPRLPLPLEPPLGDDRYLFPSHELAFLVPDRGDVSEAGWARLIKPPLDLTTAHCSPVNAPVSRRAVEGWLPPASLPPVSPRPDGWRGSRRVRPTTRAR